jgi:peroxiredoxin/outer membrane lipoprotein-sorting protein
MRPIVTLLFVIIFISSKAQNPEEIIRSVMQAQKNLRTVSYTTQRIDTFTTGDIWDHTGKVKTIKDDADKEFGFEFWAKRDDMNNEVLYDGRMTYNMETEKKTYRTIAEREYLLHVLGAPGGQMVFKDLVRLDTSNAKGFEAKETADKYFLRMRYADNAEYNITNRFKVVTIDKKTMLPVEMTDHLEALGKPQTSHFIIKDIQVNDANMNFDPADKNFLQAYQQEVPKLNKTLLGMVGKPFSAFSLTAFNGSTVSSDAFKGKVVLLDFWEVWCGPCIASMPKVQKLWDQYKDKNFLAYGIINETGQLESSKKLVEKKNFAFPMLIGNEKIKQDYHLNAVPLYVLIDKQGNISFVHEGYSDELEKAVERLVGE